ncbi:hypothetical protein BT67DRAFT_38765 [Trichocladium antarcticum]|uniref:Secreted protein n=1 Tax=Trichocladium antarcticum TaxID=1450529 RepID=A0AAN6UJ03_9PEZI|nr:hypothetical protein BT67DRAFT_38765 [Trichocladium antarcticum]
MQARFKYGCWAACALVLAVSVRCDDKCRWIIREAHPRCARIRLPISATVPATLVLQMLRGCPGDAQLPCCAGRVFVGQDWHSETARARSGL